MPEPDANPCACEFPRPAKLGCGQRADGSGIGYSVETGARDVKKILLVVLSAALLSGCLLWEDTEDCYDCYDDGYTYTPPPSDELIRARPR